MEQSKSQASLEFITIFGIAFTIMVILGGIYIGYFQSEKQTLDHTYVSSLGEQFMDNIEKVYFLGKGNRLTIDTKFPEGITNITIVHRSNFTVPGPKNVSFDTLNITMVAQGEYFSNYFTTSEFYIRFNCTRCYHNNVTNVSYYNISQFSPGFKKIRFQSEGDVVNVDFIQE